MASTGDTWRLGRRPALQAGALLVPLLAALIAMVLLWGRYTQINWLLVGPAARGLLHGDLRIYAEYPKAQMGPLALLLIEAVPRPYYQFLVCGLLPVALRVACLGVQMTPRRWLCVLGGGLVLAWPWTELAGYAHADDALVIIGALLMVAALREQRAWLVGGAFLLAIAAKPTAIVLLPLLLLTRRRTLAAALVGMALVWAPFALADLHGFLAAGKGVMIVRPGSIPALLGSAVGGPYPAWVRPVELFGGMAVCWAGARRASPAAGVAAAFAFRALLEPGAFDMYSVSVIATALAVDVTRRGWPASGAVGLISYVAAMGQMSGFDAVVRVAALGGVAWLALGPPCRARSGSRRGAPVLHGPSGELDHRYHRYRASAG